MIAPILVNITPRQRTLANSCPLIFELGKTFSSISAITIYYYVYFILHDSFEQFWPSLASESSGDETRFFSQRPCTYFWSFFCKDGNVNSVDSCNYGFLDLFTTNMRDNTTGEIDLNGLPWGEIAGDLEEFTGLNMADLKYTQTGPGKLISHNFLYEFKINSIRCANIVPIII